MLDEAVLTVAFLFVKLGGSVMLTAIVMVNGKLGNGKLGNGKFGNHFLVGSVKSATVNWATEKVGNR